MRHVKMDGMSSSDDPLQSLAQRAETAVADQQARAENVAAQAEAARQKQASKRTLLAVLLVACVASLTFQWRAFREPFPTAQPGESTAVAEGDLRAMAVFVDAYRLSQGRYPEKLDDVRLPEGMASLVRDHGVRYASTQTGYTLQWSLPAQHVVYDSATGEARINPSNKP